MLRFAYLPPFAAWLLTHIDEYTAEIVRLFREADFSLLRNLSHLSDEEQFRFSKRLNIEFLTNLSQNNAAGHINAITSRWLADQFENVGKLDVDAKDITTINYVRSKAQKAFINQYTTDLVVAYHLHSEIDDLSFLFNTRSFTDYLKVLREKIEQEGRFSQRLIEASRAGGRSHGLFAARGAFGSRLAAKAHLPRRHAENEPVFVTPHPGQCRWHTHH
jgi:hypothetical protein